MYNTIKKIFRNFFIVTFTYPWNNYSFFIFQDIEKFAEERKKRGVDVTELCFEDSPHVKHFSWYKEEYTNSVISFLKKCLSLKSNFYKTTDTKK